MRFGRRADMPRLLRYVTAAVAGVILLVVVIGFYKGRSRSPFKLKNEHARLSDEVIAEVHGYERLESDGQTPKYYIRADTARTYSDNHQELENAYIRTYDSEGNSSDELTADKALYVPEEAKNFTAYLNGNVSVSTRDGLVVKTASASYTRRTERAESDELVTFERDNIRGRAFGAVVDIAEKRLELQKDVEVESFESSGSKLENIRYAKLNSDTAVYDQKANSIAMNGSFAADIDSAGRKTKATAGRSLVSISGADSASLEVKKIELFDTVKIASAERVGSVTMDCSYAVYDKDRDLFDLRDGTHIVSSQNGTVTDIKAGQAVYDRRSLTFDLINNAEVIQAGNYLSGGTIHVDLFEGNRIRNALVTGNALVRQTTADRTTQVSANKLTAAYSDGGSLQWAAANESVRAELIPADDDQYSKVTMSTPRSMRVAFKGEGSIDKMTTDGRTTIQLDVKDDRPDAADKRVTADSVATFFNSNGKYLSRAEAVGNAELFVQPKRASTDNYTTAITAPRFDCDFFPTGNNARLCVGGTKTKTIRTPTLRTAANGIQSLLSDTVSATFNSSTKDVDLLTANGSARFNELDRNGKAATITFSQSDRIVRLRGGEPTLWDDRSRARAAEIDWNTSDQRSELRGGVSTTFYNVASLGNAAPFDRSERPVFVTSDAATFYRTTELGIYLGNARAWQGDNYVRSDKLSIWTADGKMLAEGNVQSALYDAKMKRNGRELTSPVFAAASTMSYTRSSRLLSYRQNVDIRQGTDRITSTSADVLLNDRNEVDRTVAEGNVVLTQPGRKATANWVQYTSADEVAILRGDPATVSDAENGGSQSAQITVYMRENRFQGDGKSRQNPNARVKSVYRVKNPQ